MPVGPSHSARSGGSSGGSFGGSSRSGGFNSSRSSSSPRPRSPINFVWFGKPVVISTGVQNMLISLIVIFVMLVMGTVGCFINFGTNSKELADARSSIAIYESDAEYYQNLITRASSTAEEDAAYIKTKAYFVPKMYSQYTEDDFNNTGAFEYGTYRGVVYYFITYCYKDADGNWRQGETYTQFASSAVRAMFKNAEGFDSEILENFSNTTGTGLSANVMVGEMDVAYVNDIAEGGYFSINTNYSLDKNIDYLAYKSSLKELESSKKSSLVLGIVLTCITLLVLAIGIVVAIRKIKKENEKAQVEAAENAAAIEKAKAEAETAKSEAAKKNRFCQYCGAPVADGAEQCSACGARLFNKTPNGKN